MWYQVMKQTYGILHLYFRLFKVMVNIQVLFIWFLLNYFCVARAVCEIVSSWYVLIDFVLNLISVTLEFQWYSSWYSQGFTFSKVKLLFNLDCPFLICQQVNSYGPLKNSKSIFSVCFRSWTQKLLRWTSWHRYKFQRLAEW